MAWMPSGTTTSTYDHFGNVVTTVSPSGTVYTSFDAGNRPVRKTTTPAGSSTNTQVATWTYDTLQKGQLTSSTATTLVGSTPYMITSAVTSVKTSIGML